ncbi:signal peptidase I [Pseudalkalibacillus hwajinpoensis]|uniref:Signal peptidase I n=1 Tax=Guptibacillus hwajinpoensis TaxID=208199 RepID=A0A4U1MMM9_9BACL|nr:signal peptidase I [Pseudalkalibacillus hwajinpoensis]TKD72034.1 signal peptidase I [Pseudalkalibacillus hwajinpoensis]
MKTESQSNWLKEWGTPLLFAIILAFVIKMFFVAPYIVEGASMDPTLHDGDRLLVNKFISYVQDEPARGDIIIIKDVEAEKHYVKRVIGLPGDTVEMKQDKLLVNGEELNEPYLSSNRSDAETMGMHLTEDFGPVNVPEDQLFVMGDNRLRSMDSRNGLGKIELDEVVGKAEVVWFPFKDVRSTK